MRRFHAVAKWAEVIFLFCSAWTLDGFRLCAEEGAAPLEFRQIVNDRVAETGKVVPRDAVQVFVYQGEPVALRVGDSEIAVDYGQSGCLFDRGTGRMTRRFTLANGWPGTKPAVFGQPSPPNRRGSHLLGPGVVNPRIGEKDKAVAVEICFKGRIWRALQPPRFLNSLGKDWIEQREKFSTWTVILQVLNESSWVEADSGDGTPPRRYTIADGLPGNIVTHFAESGGVLWAACVDIYDPKKKAWGLGGLCRYSEAKDRWEKVEAIEGKPARWVTLLQAIGDELWVGFREGDGIEGDSIVYGMGLYPGEYRPRTTAILLAQLKKGKWTVFSRVPVSDSKPPFRPPSETSDVPPPTEKPVHLVRQDDRMFLFSQASSIRLGGNWDVPLDGRVSGLDLANGEWRTFEATRDLDADVLTNLVEEKGEVLVASNKGAHRWDEKAKSWWFLDPECTLRNPSLSAATPVGDELWVGYAKQSFGVTGQQGISRFHEKTGKWSYTSPEEIGTACPVSRIVALPNGEVWALFARRREITAAVEFPYFEPEKNRPQPPGVGRFAEGKWTFPVVLEEVPATIERETRMRDGSVQRHSFPVEIENLAAVGNHLFAVNQLGVFMGPAPWKQVFSNPSAQERSPYSSLWIEASGDGKALLITRADQKLQQENPRKVLQARYVPGDKEVRFEAVTLEVDLWRLQSQGDLLEGRGDTVFGRWVSVPATKEGKWVFGPYSENAASTTRKVVETREAVWIASHGQLIRLDRGKLADYLGEQHAGE